jgi:tetrahydromethanopterin S-methyltransferase subunit E
MSDPPVSVSAMRAARAAPVRHSPVGLLVGRVLIVLGVLALAGAAALALFPTDAEASVPTQSKSTSTVRCGIPLKVLMTKRSSSASASARSAQAVCRKKADDRVGFAVPLGLGGVVAVVAGATSTAAVRRRRHA